jgi:D-arabinose 1-dehydrogenase-like Zn-dependent alcohol dehydrogenase
MVGNRVMFEDMLRAMAANGIKPMVDKVFPFDAAKDAFETAGKGDFIGKVVIRI